MNIKYTILVSTLILTACGSDTETQTPAMQQAAQTSPSQVVQKADVSEQNTPQVSADVSSAVQAENSQADASATMQKAVSQMDTTQTDGSTNTAEKSDIELPLGRLTGIVDTGEYKQAIINNQGQVTRLKEGDDWQGWQVTTIDQEKLVISRNGEDHSLNLLSEFRSPQLTETELANQNMNDKNDDLAEKEKTESTTEKPFTEEQLTELRSRLLMGRE